jgi:hypothetical protein
VRLSHNHLVPAVLMLRGLSVLGLLMVAWALPRLARVHGRLPQRALWLGLANPFVLVHGIGVPMVLLSGRLAAERVVGR